MLRGYISGVLGPSSQKKLVSLGATREDLVGLVRLDILLFGRLVVPDTHLFDGSLFVDGVGPRELAEICGHTPDRNTVEVRFRTGDFESSLRDFVAAGNDHLRPVEYRALGDNEAEAALAASILSNPSFSGARSAPDALLSRMTILGVSGRRVEALREHWRRWAEDDSSKKISHRWPDRPFDLAGQCGLVPLDREWLLGSRGGELVDSVEDLIFERRDTRSASLDALLRTHLAVEDARIATQDVGIVREWYADRRQETLAWQHQCVFSTDVEDRTRLLHAAYGDVAMSHIAPHLAKTDAAAVVGVAAGLSALSSQEFGELWDLTRGPRNNYLSATHRGALEDLVGDICSRVGGAGGSARPRFVQEFVLPPVAGSTTVAATSIGEGGAELEVIGGAVVALGVAKLVSSLSRWGSQRGQVKSLVRWARSGNATKLR